MIDLSKQELIDVVYSDSAVGKNAKKLLSHILNFTDEHTLLLYLIASLSCEDILNDELCMYCESHNCFPLED